MKDEAFKLLIKSFKPQLEIVFNEYAPILPVDRSQYPLTQKLPGPFFDPSRVSRSTLKYDANGNLLLRAGDYVVPVMTYCMKQEGSSPNGHIYSLSKLEGTRAVMIRELNLLGSPKFNTQDLQIVYWSLQAGLSYDEMTKESQEIINEIIPQYKPLLKESFLSILEKKWNKVSDNSNGLISSLEESSESLLKELGNVGQKIIGIRRFKARLDEVGNDYSQLSELINTTSLTTSLKKSDTSWSQISKNVYARFVTSGHYQEIGFVQIRILKENQNRVINSFSGDVVSFELVSLVGNPGLNSIQPLAFSPLYGYAGVMALPVLLENPLAATMVLAAVLTANTINWDTFFKLLDLLKYSSDTQVKEEIGKGINVLQEAHDELEKPLKEAGIITDKTKNTSTNEKTATREYSKIGGEKEQKKDFDKLPGKMHTASDGTEYKSLPNGNNVVKRPATDKQAPTLEVQSSQNDSKNYEKLRIKVRYL
ncbi:MAG: hypothetical protein HOP07_00630 [Bacteriovoracaceae bacterium]|nr:hypothetical protein [Bacteriovoracaceae bacterium]